MYINTRSHQDMILSVCDVLNINEDKLDNLLEECYNKLQVNHPIFILDEQYNYLMKYVEEHLTVDIDEILFIHLARRLNGDFDNNGYNLIDVLVNDTSLSRFLKKYGLTFKYDKYIRMFKDSQEIDLCSNEDKVYNYLRYRFGYVINDFSMKGYAFGDALENNIDYDLIHAGPGFFEYIYPFVNDNLIDDFMENSKLYKFEYLVSINDICFENYEELDYKEKQNHIIVKVLQRLYTYKYEAMIYDDDNPIIGMKGNHTLESKNLISKIDNVK